MPGERLVPLGGGWGRRLGTEFGQAHAGFPEWPQPQTLCGHMRVGSSLTRASLPHPAPSWRVLGAHSSFGFYSAHKVTAVPHCPFH